MNPLIVTIVAGIGLGALYSKKTGRELYSLLDSYLVLYLLPILFLFTGSRFAGAAEQNLKVAGILSAIKVISLGVSFFVARRVIKLENEEMIRGFMVLSVCSNTGHGLMLLQAGSPDPETMKMAITAFYQGFLTVVIVPQLLISVPGKRRETLKAIFTMIAFHPVSYSCIFGFGLALKPEISYLYAVLLAARIAVNRIWSRGWTLCDPKPLMVFSALLVLTHLFGRDFEFVKPYALFVTFVTALTIGSKMASQKMERSHWRVVAGVMAFGLMIEPFIIGLPLAKLGGCSLTEGFVIGYMTFQPPAYLGIIWLRTGKFGKLPVSEWAFALQAIAAYVLAIFFPELLRRVF